MLRDEIVKIIKDWFGVPVIYKDEDGKFCADDILALIDGQRCIWEYDDANKVYMTDCGIDFNTRNKWDFDRYPFCPCCGKMIEVKDERPLDSNSDQ